jgi:two-component system, NarL family, response regulator YdfI
VSAESGEDEISVWLCAASPAVRSGLRALLAQDARIRITAEQASPSEWGSPEFVNVIVLAASRLSAATGKFLQSYSGPAQVLLITDEPFPGWAQLACVAGELTFSASARQLCAAIAAAAAGLRVFDPITPPIFIESSNNEPHAQDAQSLTVRESQVLQLLSEGFSNKQIAQQLKISAHTVKFHISAILSKLNASNRTEAVHRGVQGGFVHL